MMLTQLEYVISEELRCPNCGSEEAVGADEPHFEESNLACIDLWCRKCGATWVEYYVLAGYIDLVLKGDK